MPSTIRNRITGLVLLAIALVWSVLVVATIPAGQGDGDVGARAFPLLLGILLAALSVAMVAISFVGEEPDDDFQDQSDELSSPGGGGRLEYRIALSVFLCILGYGFLMERVGFLLATPIVIAFLLVILLRLRRPVLIASLAVGLTVGCWFVFGKLLGAYLPQGTWISLG